MFSPGQLVICIVDYSTVAPIQGAPNLPAKGVVYTVRDAVVGHRLPGIRLMEVVNPPVECVEGFLERVFSSRDFRPLDRARLDVFRRALAPQPVEAIA